MEEVKIWIVEGKHAVPLDSVGHTETEALLEDILVCNPNVLAEGLTLVGRQTRTTSGWLDLLGVDADGRLVVFELKRGTLNRDAVTQIIDYASALDEMDQIGELHEHIAEQSGTGGVQEIVDFEEWYGNNFDQSLDSLTPTRMFLVGLGIDETAERMVNYLFDHGLDISLLTFYGFIHDGKTLFARYVESKPPDTSIRRQQTTSVAERRRIFEERIAELGMLDTFNAIREMFREHFQYHFHFASRYRMSFNRDSLAYLFIEMDENSKSLKVGFHPRAVDLALEEFERLIAKDLPTERGPAQNATHTERVNYEVKFPLYTLEDWNNYKDELIKLTRSVYAAYQKKQSN